MKERLDATLLLAKLNAIETLGVPVRVRMHGLRALAVLPPIGPRILARCIEVLLAIGDERRRYWALAGLPAEERGIAEQCFPDAPKTVAEHLRAAPDWLLNSEISCPPSRRFRPAGYFPLSPRFNSGITRPPTEQS